MTTRAKTSIILLSTLVIGVAVGALASGALRDRREHAIHRMPPHHRFIRAMRDIIQPDEQQAESIDNILSERSKQLSALNEQHQNQVFAIMDSMRTELTAVLTDEQSTRLEQQLSSGLRRGFAKRLARLTEELQLTEEQADHIREIMAKMEKGRPTRRDFKRSPHAFRKEMRSRFEQIHQEVEAVLTPEQQEKYREWRMQRGGFWGPRRGASFRRGEHDPK